MNCRRLFNLLQFYWLLLLFYSAQTGNASNGLDEFLIAYDDAKSELQWIENVKSEEKRSTKQHKHRVTNKGDAWYENYRRAEHKGGVQHDIKESGIMKAIIQLKERFQNLESESKPSKNYLSDEAANEKLSKNEQEQLPVYKRNFDDKEVNPYDEINLKISNRMIAKGMGPSLPSELYGDVKDYYRPAYYGLPNEQVQQIEKQDEFLEHKIPNYNLFKRGLAPQRKLLAFDNYDYGNFPDVADFYDFIGEGGNCSDIEVKNETRTSTIPTPKKESSPTTLPPPTAVKVQLNLELNGTMPSSVANATSGGQQIDDSKSMKTKREVDEMVSKVPRIGAENTKIDMGQLISGELPNKIMLSILELINCDENLKTIIGPTVEKRKKMLEENHKLKTNFETQPVKEEQSKIMNLMKTLNNLIENQVYERTCVKLTPDLEAFYSQLMRAGAGTTNPRRQKRQEEDVSKQQLQQKSEVVNSLLKKFEKLESGEQDTFKNIKNGLLEDKRVLQDLEEQFAEESRQKRSSISKDAQPKVTDKFDKLVKMVGFIKNDALLGEDDDEF